MADPGGGNKQDDSDKRRENTRRQLRDYYHYWWRGKAKDWTESEREGKSGGSRTALKGKWPGHKDPELYDLDEKLRQYQPQKKKVSRSRGDAHDGDDELRESLKGTAVNHVGLLGHGGLGFASLCEIDNGKGEKQRVVIKKTLPRVLKERPDVSLIDREKKFYKTLSGCMHTLQTESLQSLAGKRPGDSGDSGSQPKKKPKGGSHNDGGDVLRELDEDSETLVLEYAPNGTLADLLRRVNEKGPEHRIPNRALWLLFRCLLRACFGMLAPVRHNRANSNAPAARLELEQGGKTKIDMIHFDLDPSNVLIAGWDGKTLDHVEHRLVPRLIVSDFGLSDCRGRLKQVPHLKWVYRRKGKPSFFAPEQFTPEWDYIDGDPPHDAVGGTAGMYSALTNIYQIGQIMACLITGSYPIYPPICEKTPYLQGGLHKNTAGGQQQHHWSYGGYLLNDRFKDYDGDLRLIIAQCMSHVPCHRPDVAVLGNIIGRYLNTYAEDQAEGETDEDIRAWTKKMFVPHKPIILHDPRQDP